MHCILTSCILEYICQFYESLQFYITEIPLWLLCKLIKIRYNRINIQYIRYHKTWIFNHMNPPIWHDSSTVSSSNSCSLIFMPNIIFRSYFFIVCITKNVLSTYKYAYMTQNALVIFVAVTVIYWSVDASQCIGIL